MLFQHRNITNSLQAQAQSAKARDYKDPEILVTKKYTRFRSENTI